MPAMSKSQEIHEQHELTNGPNASPSPTIIKYRFKLCSAKGVNMSRKRSSRRLNLWKLSEQLGDAVVAIIAITHCF